MNIHNLKFIGNDDNSCEVVLGVKVNPYPYVEENKEEGWQRENPLRGGQHGLQWNFQGKTIKIFDDSHIFGYPDPQMDSVVAIYPLDSKLYPAPNNAVIYNPDGTLRMQLKMPSLASGETDKEYAYFKQVGWDEYPPGNPVTAMWIGYGDYQFEIRILNTETGEFDKGCLMYGRL